VRWTAGRRWSSSSGADGNYDSCSILLPQEGILQAHASLVLPLSQCYSACLQSTLRHSDSVVDRHHTAGRRLFMRSVAAARATSDPAIHTHVTWARQEMRLANHALVSPSTALAIFEKCGPPACSSAAHTTCCPCAAGLANQNEAEPSEFQTLSNVFCRSGSCWARCWGRSRGTPRRCTSWRWSRPEATKPPSCVPGSSGGARPLST
jgi:hypothetical protein